MAIQDGIQHVVCTPHANERYEYDRGAAQAKLNELQRRAGDSVRFSLGCDFHLSFENIQDALAAPESFLITGSDYLLVEFSDYAIPPALGEAIQRFAAMGIVPVITHPERNLMMLRKPEQVLRFIEIGCVVQVTANSVTGFWGEGPKRMVHWLMAHDAVHFVATDAHDTKHRPPLLSEARATMAKEYGKELADILFHDNPMAVVTGIKLPYLPSSKPA